MRTRPPPVTSPLPSVTLLSFLCICPLIYTPSFDCWHLSVVSKFLELLSPSLNWYVVILSALFSSPLLWLELIQLFPNGSLRSYIVVNSNSFTWNKFIVGEGDYREDRKRGVESMSHQVLEKKTDSGKRPLWGDWKVRDLCHWLVEDHTVKYRDGGCPGKEYTSLSIPPYCATKPQIPRFSYFLLPCKHSANSKLACAT